MIALRFRSLGYAAGVVFAATCLYLVSVQAAVERGKLQSVERRIAAAHRDIRQLQTEAATRGSLRQLEKWNAEVLALSAPKADQYVRGGIELVALTVDVPAAAAPARPHVMQASMAKQPAVAQPRLQQANYVKPAGELQRPLLLPVSVVDQAAEEHRERP